MKKEEKELFLRLCSFQGDRFDESLLSAATPVVLGHLFFNRMQGVAYGTLKKHGFLEKVNREFRNSLKGAYEQNREKNESFFWCVEHLEEILSKSDASYAMLKGAYLCKRYPEGFRTSNDIDLLVLPEDVTKIGDALLQNGFHQGNIRSGDFQPATRKEIIESKMTRGETVPYIKKVDLPGMQFLEVDINFSFDYKTGDTALLEKILERTVVEEMPSHRVRTLRQEDFFIHLCCHLYKEATTLPWVEMARDMTLYKYSDIYMLLNNLSKEDTEKFFCCAKELGMERVCAFAVLQTAQLFCFENQNAVKMAESFLKDVPEWIHTVFSPKEKKTYVYTEKDITRRFFSDCRKALLEEV